MRDQIEKLGIDTLFLLDECQQGLVLFAHFVTIELIFFNNFFLEDLDNIFVRPTGLLIKT